MAIRDIRCTRETGIFVEGLRVRYGATEAVAGLDFSLGRADKLCIIGANGAGKTSALMALTGLLARSGGLMTVDGAEGPKGHARWYLDSGVVLVPEGMRNFTNMSVVENLTLPLRTLRRDPAYSWDVEEVYGLFPVLGARSRQLAGTLSGGEQKMLAIARGLMAAPKYFFIDEPTLGLAPIVIERIAMTMKELVARGVSIVVAEQRIQFVESLGGRVIVMERGVCVLRGEDINEPVLNHNARIALLGSGINHQPSDSVST